MCAQISRVFYGQYHSFRWREFRRRVREESKESERRRTRKTKSVERVFLSRRWIRLGILFFRFRILLSPERMIATVKVSTVGFLKDPPWQNVALTLLFLTWPARVIFLDFTCFGIVSGFDFFRILVFVTHSLIHFCSLGECNILFVCNCYWNVSVKMVNQLCKEEDTSALIVCLITRSSEFMNWIWQLFFFIFRC